MPAAVEIATAEVNITHFSGFVQTTLLMHTQYYMYVVLHLAFLKLRMKQLHDKVLGESAVLLYVALIY